MAIGDHATQHVDKEIDRAAMPRVLDLRDILELINDSYKGQWELP
jgi:hypothetical protein